MVSIDAGYVFQFLKSNMQILESGFKGAGLKHISKAYLSEIAIPHPEELGDQMSIAHLLEKVERLITERKKHLQQLDDLLKSVFLETFGDPIQKRKGLGYF
jgi:type I restriction enzyme S subunit